MVEMPPPGGAMVEMPPQVGLWWKFHIPYCQMPHAGWAEVAVKSSAMAPLVHEGGSGGGNNIDRYRDRCIRA